MATTEYLDMTECRVRHILKKIYLLVFFHARQLRPVPDNEVSLINDAPLSSIGHKIRVIGTSLCSDRFNWSYIWRSMVIMTDITAASSLSAVLHQTTVAASHEAYSAARSGHNVPLHSASGTNNVPDNLFSADGTFLGSNDTNKKTSPLSQAIDFLV